MDIKCPLQLCDAHWKVQAKSAGLRRDLQWTLNINIYCPVVWLTPSDNTSSLWYPDDNVDMTMLSVEWGSLVQQVFVNGWGLFENWLCTEVSVFLSRHQWLLVWEMYWHIFCLLTSQTIRYMWQCCKAFLCSQRGQNLRSQLIPPFFNVHIVLSHSSYALDPCFGRLTEIQFLRS